MTAHRHTPYPSTLLPPPFTNVPGPRTEPLPPVPKWVPTNPHGPVKNACLTCRQKKARCDGAMPVCGQCSKKHLECLYIKSKRGGARRKREMSAPSALAQYLAKLDGLTSVPRFTLPKNEPMPHDDPTDVVREFSSRDEVLRCYYQEMHPFVAVMPPRHYMSDYAPLLLHDSPFILACQTVMTLSPHPLDTQPKSASSRRLRAIAARRLADRAYAVVQSNLQGNIESIENVQGLIILAVYEWGAIGDIDIVRERYCEAMQVAMSMGLHEMDIGGEPFVLEGLSWTLDMRRRTWWFTYTYQLTMALVSGSKPFFGPDEPHLHVAFPVCSPVDRVWSNWINTIRQCFRVISFVNSVDMRPRVARFSDSDATALGNSWGASVPCEGDAAERRRRRKEMVQIDRQIMDMMKEAERLSVIDHVSGGEEEVARNLQVATRLGLAVMHIHVHRHQAFPEVSFFSKAICGLPIGQAAFDSSPDSQIMAAIASLLQRKRSSGGASTGSTSISDAANASHPADGNDLATALMNDTAAEAGTIEPETLLSDDAMETLANMDPAELNQLLLASGIDMNTLASFEFGATAAGSSTGNDPLANAVDPLDEVWGTQQPPVNGSIATNGPHGLVPTDARARAGSQAGLGAAGGAANDAAHVLANGIPENGFGRDSRFPARTETAFDADMPQVGAGYALPPSVQTNPSLETAKSPRMQPLSVMEARQPRPNSTGGHDPSPPDSPFGFHCTGYTTEGYAQPGYINDSTDTSRTDVNVIVYNALRASGAYGIPGPSSRVSPQYAPSYLDGQGASAQFPNGDFYASDSFGSSAPPALSHGMQSAAAAAPGRADALYASWAASSGGATGAGGLPTGSFRDTPSMTSAFPSASQSSTVGSRVMPFASDMWVPHEYPAHLSTPWFAQPGGAAHLYRPLNAMPVWDPPVIPPVHVQPPLASASSINGGAVSYTAPPALPAAHSLPAPVPQAVGTRGMPHLAGLATGAASSTQPSTFGSRSVSTQLSTSGSGSATNSSPRTPHSAGAAGIAVQQANKARAWGVDDAGEVRDAERVREEYEDAALDALDDGDEEIYPPGLSLGRCATAAHTIVRLEVIHRSASMALAEGPPRWLPFCSCGLVTGAYAFLLLALAVQAESEFEPDVRRVSEVEALLTNVKIILAGLEAYGVMWDAIDAMAAQVREALASATRLPREIRAQIQQSK